jgi:hypothetical protein
LAALLLIGSFGATSARGAAEGAISNAVLIPGSYCHLTFPAIREETLAGNRPVLEDPSTGEIIDFYGPCDTDPRGTAQIQAQRLENQHRWETEYSD